MNHEFKSSMVPFPSFDEETRLCEHAALWWWKAGQKMSGHQNPVIAVLTLRGIVEGVEKMGWGCWGGSWWREHKDIFKCKSNLMSSPRHNLIKSTYERNSSLYNIRMEVVVISFTDWRYIPSWEEIQPKNGKISICSAYSYSHCRQIKQMFFEGKQTK